MTTRLWTWLALAACALWLAACGGGGGSPGAVPGGTAGGTSGTVTVTTLDGAGAASKFVTSAAPLTVSALVKDKDGKAVADAVVAFATDSTLALMSTSSGTSLSNSSGIATMTLRPAGTTVSGAGKITVSVTLAGATVPITGAATYTVGSTATSTASLAVALFNAGGQASNSVTSAAPLTAKATVKDQDGKAIANALVIFSTDNALATLAPSAGTALTDASGVASVTVRPANLAVGGAGTLKAAVTVGGTTIASDANYSVNATALTLGVLSLTPSHIAAYGSSVVSVDVLASGVKYTGQAVTVNFTSSSCGALGKAILPATASTIGGSAKVVYRDQGCGDVDQVSASIDGTTVASSANLTIDPPTVASIQFTSASPTDKSIVIAGQGGNGRQETATLVFTVLDNSGNPSPGKTIDFSTTSPDVTINILSATSAGNGQVITTVNSGATPTSFRIKATLHGTAIATLSDSVVVTTGLPVQRAFSLSVGSPNIEGWSYDSGPTVPATTVNVLLADQAGNPVPDGTPVVFQTNLGAIGSSAKGACNTFNGGCSVDFRSQNPRSAAGNSPATPCNNLAAGGSDDSFRDGLATVCASTTDGSNTLFSKVGIFFSGSGAPFVYMDGSLSELTGAVVDLGQVGRTESKVFLLQINDLHLNPMPAGTRVEVTNVASASSGGVSPATVPNVFPSGAVTGNGVVGNQGSFHTVTIASTLAKDCTTDNQASFNVAITTPRLITTNYPFKLLFKCF
ncbi:Ig-like domain-containing protein [Janthinobacterium sp.]|uniref:Ig-like domain-containing protein n=1 Tax=Janthinobacterium sp. TaxID=1871054 RepID=UPI00293D521B|nr:Ig-like domain-containing protein [Janthinobacterium sp.]